MRKVLLFALFFGLITVVAVLVLNSCSVTKNQQGDEQVSEINQQYLDSIDHPITSLEFNYLYVGRSSIHAPFGYPQDNDTLDDYIIEKPQYILSYCKKKNLPNWVAWQLNEDWVGDAPRKSGRFLIEPNLPNDFFRVNHDHYTNSGYDRGHLVRSKERTKNIEDNVSTFEMGNIIPQTPDLNRGVWLRFEEYCMDKALDEGKDIFIIAGGIFNDTITLKGEGHVVIPDSCFKIAVFTNDTNHDSLKFDEMDKIAIAMPNSSGIRRDDWQKYITTVGHIQRSTGYRFFGKVR
jgi:endonuclease G